jgi:hypothetical protein
VGLGEPNVKRALAWILERLAEDPAAGRAALVDRASREFDLSPLEADFLLRQLTPARPGGGSAP